MSDLQSLVLVRSVVLESKRLELLRWEEGGGGPAIERRERMEFCLEKSGVGR